VGLPPDAFNNGQMKTGGQGGTWIVLDRPKPPAVDDCCRYWGDPPPELSERCRYWLRQIERGWRPNRFIRLHCYDCAAEWYGVWIWEYINVIRPRVVSAG
jgi:hypothetical protein